jgi:quercetin dioxygenase-like cupin family protein
MMKHFRVEEVEVEVKTEPSQRGIRSRRIISRDIVGTDSMVMLHAEIPPGIQHSLHRHPGADQVTYVLEGACEQFTETGATLVEKGDVLFTPAGEWHGTRNNTEVPSVLLTVYAGVGTPAEAGYELPEAR